MERWKYLLSELTTDCGLFNINTSRNFSEFWTISFSSIFDHHGKMKILVVGIDNRVQDRHFQKLWWVSCLFFERFQSVQFLIIVKRRKYLLSESTTECEPFKIDTSRNVREFWTISFSSTFDHLGKMKLFVVWIEWVNPSTCNLLHVLLFGHQLKHSVILCKVITVSLCLKRGSLNDFGKR